MATRKYVVKDFTDVISYEFVGMIDAMEPNSSNKIQHIMNKIEEYEVREDLDFVCFFGKQQIVFKQVI